MGISSSQTFVLNHSASVRRVHARVNISTFCGNAPAAFGLSTIGVMLVLGVAAPAIAPYEPAVQDVRHLLEGPSAAHALGTDDLGRDTLSRVIFGAQPALFVSFIATGFAVVAGTSLGLAAGYIRGVVDTVLMRVMDGLLAVPMLVVALTITAMVGPSLNAVSLAIGVANIPVFARLARGQTLAVRVFDYVTAARALGAQPTRVMGRHVLPNIIAPIIVQVR